MSITASAPFSGAQDQTLAVAYISAFILVFFVSHPLLYREIPPLTYRICSSPFSPLEGIKWLLGISLALT